LIDPEILKLNPKDLRLIDIDGKHLGIFSLEKAKEIAEKNEFDLILINSYQQPIVVKLGNYGSHLYQKEKKERKVKKEQKETKEIRISFREAEYDLKRKANLIREFLDEGHQVQIKLMLKGRERKFQDLAEEKLNNFLKIIGELTNYKISQQLKKTPNFLMIILGPSK
jgi:translation initiation factor IF-3